MDFKKKSTELEQLGITENIFSVDFHISSFCPLDHISQRDLPDLSGRHTTMGLILITKGINRPF